MNGHGGFSFIRVGIRTSTLDGMTVVSKLIIETSCSLLVIK